MSTSNWCFTEAELEDLPSFKDNISKEAEQEYRKKGTGFIKELGFKIDL